MSAARMVVSLKVLQEEDTVDKVNQHLPPDIRLHHIVRYYLDVCLLFNLNQTLQGW